MNNDEEALSLQLPETDSDNNAQELTPAVFSSIRNWADRPPSNFACFRCLFRSNAKDSFLRHILTHMEKDATNEYCHRQKMLMASITPLMLVMPSLMLPARARADEKRRNVPCDQCEFKSVSAAGLRTHQRVHKKSTANPKRRNLSVVIEKMDF